ncbi:MAG: DUF935 domain-containing protein [Bacteroidetes bacterium]|nr:DUF935 domain-containing protein [Bacteroidota bacterium]
MNKPGIWLNNHEFKQFSDQSTRVATSALATRQNNPYDFSLLGYLPDPDPVLKKIGKDISVYRELLSDSHVFSTVQQRKAGVLSLNWELDRGKTKSKTAKSVDQLLKKKIKMRRLINQVLECLPFGFQPIEIEWDIRTIPWSLKSIEAKPQEWFSFDSENRLILDYGMKGLNKGTLVPEKSFLIAQNNATYMNPYGEKLLSRCFWPVTFKRGGLKFWVQFTEKYGMPFAVGKVPRGTDQTIMDDLATKLDDMVQDAIAVIYNDQSVEILDAKSVSANAAIYEQLINYCDREISKAILTQTLTTDNTGGNGSNALGQTQAGKLDQVNAGDADTVQEVIQTLIDWYCEFNFGSGETPEFSFYEEEDVDKNLADRDAVLQEKLGVVFTQDYIADAYNIDPKYFTIVSKPEPANPPANPATPAAAVMEDQNKGVLKFRNADSSAFPDQDALDLFISFLSDSKDQVDVQGKMMDLILQPVLDLIGNSASFDDILSGLAKTFPDMDDSQLEASARKAIFISEIWGRLNAGE